MAFIGQVVEGKHTRIVFEETAASTGGARLAFRETYAVGPSSPPEHVHAQQSERFTVYRGLLGVRVAGVDTVLGPGESALVEPGQPHTLWNAGEEPCEHRVELVPALKMEDFFVGIVTLEAQGALPPRNLGEVGQVAQLFLAHENRVPWLPWVLFKPLLRCVVALAAAARRARGSLRRSSL